MHAVQKPKHGSGQLYLREVSVLLVEFFEESWNALSMSVQCSVSFSQGPEVFFWFSIEAGDQTGSQKDSLLV
jgi:hypothetical protein